MKRSTLLSILAGLLLLVTATSCERINAGHIGLKVNLTGEERGVSNIKYVTGWVWYMPGASEVVEIPTFVQHKNYEEFEVWAKGGTIFKVHPILNYSVNAERADSMYQLFRKDLSDIEEGWLKGIVQQVYRDATNTFDPDSLLNNRAGYEIELAKELQAKLNPYFHVTNTTSGLTPDDALKANIAAKANAVQEKLRIENESKSLEAQAKNDIIAAKRDSSVLVINAQSEARAILLKQEALRQSPQYIELIKAEKWNGALPQYMLGNNSSTLFSLK